MDQGKIIQLFNLFNIHSYFWSNVVLSETWIKYQHISSRVWKQENFCSELCRELWTCEPSTTDSHTQTRQLQLLSMNSTGGWEQEDTNLSNLRSFPVCSKLQWVQGTRTGESPFHSWERQMCLGCIWEEILVKALPSVIKLYTFKATLSIIRTLDSWTIFKLANYFL